MEIWQEAGKLAAYVVALPYCWRIRQDSPTSSRMRMAWTWMGVSAILATVRHAYEIGAELANWELTNRSWRQILIVTSLLALTWGLVQLGRAFREAGLAPRWKPVDGLWLLVLVALAVPVVLNRERMGDAASPVVAMRYLQYLSSFLLAMPAMVALGLHRISRSMTGGRWAVALQWMVAFLLLRLVNLCLSTSTTGWSEWLQWSNLAAPWLFTMAAIERWSVTRAAERMSEQIFVGANKPA